MIKENIDKIIDIIQDATDLDTGETSISLLGTMLKDLELVNEIKNKKDVCPKCGDYGRIYNDDSVLVGKTCKCHYE